MPLYEYKCLSCGKKFEVLQKFSDDPVATHAECGGIAEKLLSAPSFQFKGTGWYATDYGKGNGGPKTGDEKSGDSKTAESKSGESKSDGSKSDTASTKSESGSKKSDSGSSKSETKSPAPASTASDSK